MNVTGKKSFLALALFASLAGAAPLAASLAIDPRDSQAEHSGAALRATYARLAGPLAKSAFSRPLYLVSREEPKRLAGDVFAVLERPFAEAEQALAEPAPWCEVLLLPFNTKHCEVSSAGAARALTIYVGPKSNTPLELTHRLNLRFEVAARSQDFLYVVLSADEGPFGTRDYRIALEVAPLEDGRSFLHMSYSYGYGAVASLAMNAYLATVGAPKVGFTVESRNPDGTPRYVRGMRGVLERNAMRYFLAIEAYLGVLSTPTAQRAEKMLGDWFTAIERHPRQLHELERDEYLAMKRKEFLRMRAALSRVPQTASSPPSRS